MSDKSSLAPGIEPPHESNWRSLALVLAVMAGLVLLAVWYPQETRNIVLMLLGFGAVIFVHELGHFLAAKAVNIEVEAFSLGINPVVVGVKRVARGLQVRILPELIPGKGGLGALSFVLPLGRKREGETEYRVGMIPLGGFVKMLGQEDIGPDKTSDNPRAFGNRPVWQRAIVIAAGVFMNIVSAVVVFILVFLHGVEMPPAVIGDVMEGSAAAQAGLRPGDVVLALDGAAEPTFVELFLKGAFPGDDGEVELTVRHPGGEVESLVVRPEMNETLGVKQMGILPPATLTVANLREPEALERLREIGLAPGDEIVAVNGREIEHAYELDEALEPEVGEVRPGPVVLTVQRETAEGWVEREVEIPLRLGAAWRGEAPGQVLTMAPRLRVEDVVAGSPAAEAGLEEGDVVSRIGSVPNPTFEELRQVVGANAGQGVQMVVVRGGEVVELTVTPRSSRPGWQFWKDVPPTIGVASGLDTGSTYVADTQAVGEELEALPLPRGSRVVSVAGREVGSYGEVIEALLAHQGEEVEIRYVGPDVEEAQALTVGVPAGRDWIGLAWLPELGGFPMIPLNDLRVPFRGETLGEALGLGMDMTYTFIAQTYLTIKGMVMGTVQLKAASGPVGIFQMSYTIASEKSFVYYCYFMAMISVMIAVFNFLPIPILDGGLFVLLLVEKIKGSPVSVRTQTVLNYIGLVMIGGLFLYVTFNDIVRISGAG